MKLTQRVYINDYMYIDANAEKTIDALAENIKRSGKYLLENITKANQHVAPELLVEHGEWYLTCDNEYDIKLAYMAQLEVPKTPEQIAKEKEAAEKAKRRKINEKEKQQKQELALYEKLKAKYEKDPNDSK